MTNAGSARAWALAAELRAAADAVANVVEAIDRDEWSSVPRPGVWSIGKDAAHVAEAMVMHQWIVRRTIGEAVPSRRPAIERAELRTPYSPAEVAELIRQRTQEGVTLLRGLADEQLDLPTQPPRARGELLARTIQRVLIGHLNTHRREIEVKLRAARDRG